ncbi:MAG TPA: Wzz/FepE/Etk N-terminal domain-containing protein [Chloroflexota bacterium]|nr:Wzz/FepE/Etk N-terminal domain-containing protein [Chloroflexota bacterium]
MELRAFWAVILRWKWVVIAVIGAAVIASGALTIMSPPGYRAQALISFSPPPPGPNVTLPGLDEQNRSLYTQSVVEDFTKIVASPLFNQNVAKDVSFPITARQLEKAWTAKKQANHLLSLEIDAPTEAKAVALAQAGAREVVNHGQRYYAILNSPVLKAIAIDPGSSEGLTGRLLDLLFVAGRVVVGIVVGLGLAFLLDYLDDHVTSAAQAEELGFRVLGSIPKANGHARLKGMAQPPSANGSGAAAARSSLP